MKTSDAISRQRAIKNATASVRMEGFRITPEMQSYGQQVLDGKMTMQQAVKQMNRDNEVVPEE